LFLDIFYDGVVSGSSKIISEQEKVVFLQLFPELTVKVDSESSKMQVNY